jgi:multidrug efflux pump subunit AcrA (membrane-fusion protein)
MKKKKVIITVAIVAIAAIIAIIAWPKKSVPVEFEMTDVQPDTIRNSVTATGTIEPVTEVEVGTQVSGIISNIYVDYNSLVKKGQVIAELDKTTLNSELNSARANLASAKSELDYQTANYKRYKTLNEKGLVSRNDYEVAYLDYRKALETYNTTKESVKKAETNIGYATITSPIDGIVLSKEVEEGQTVAASFETPTLFTIAKDLTDMRHRRSRYRKCERGTDCHVHRRCISQRHLPRASDTSQTRSHGDRQRHHLRSRHFRTEQRPQTETRTDSQRIGQHTGTYKCTECKSQSLTLHPDQRSTGQSV